MFPSRSASHFRPAHVAAPAHAPAERTVLAALAAVVALLCAGDAAAQSVDSVAPDLLRRDTTTEIVVRGTALESVTDVGISGVGLVVSNVAVTETLVRFDVGVGATAATGLRDVVLEIGSDEPVVLSEALEVVPGAISVLSLTPSSAARGDEVTLTVAGSNLDTVQAYDFGDDIDVSGFTTSSATRTTVTIAVGDGAFSGLRAVTASRPGDSFTLPAAFEVTGGLPALASVSPTSLVRDTTAEVTLVGSNLDAIDAVSFGPRISVTGFTVDTPNQARATITVLEDAVSGPRDVTLRAGETSYPFDDAFTVEPGAIEVLAIRPDRLRQGDVTFLAIDGANLDGMTEFDAGEGVTVTAINAAFPTSASVDVEVALDAPVGFRDVRITTGDGSVVVEDGLIIGEYVPPALDVRIPEELDIGDTQIGSYRLGGLLVENGGEQDETVELIGVDGDTDLFSLVEPDGTRVNRTAVTLGPGDQVTIPVEFSPELRGRTGVQYDVTARGGEEVGAIIVRANGERQELLWALETPYDLGIHPAGERVSLLRVDTVLRDGVPGRQVLVEDWSLRVTRDGEVVDDPDLFTVDFQSTLAGGELYWGTTEVLWTIQGPAGSYEGALVLHTDSTVAPFVPFAFIIDLEGDGPADTGADTGVDAGSDAGTDTNTDAGTDANTDVAVDTTGDTGTDSGTDTSIDTNTDTSADVGADATPSDAGNDDGGDDGGCNCAAAPGRGNAGTGLLLLAALAFVRRRR